MAYNTGKLLFIFLVAVLLSCIASWLTAHRYRRAMQRLMRAPAAGVGNASVAMAVPNLPAPGPVSLADNHRAGVRLTLLLVGLSILLALSSAVIYILLAFPDEPFAPRRAVMVALLHLWPVIPALSSACLISGAVRCE